MEAKAEFLAEIAVEFAEEGAELNAVEAVVEADIGSAGAELVVLDVVDKEAGDFGAAPTEGLRFEDAGVAIFAGHEYLLLPFEGEGAIGAEAAYGAGGETGLHLDDGADLVLFATVLLSSVEAEEDA